MFNPLNESLELIQTLERFKEKDDETAQTGSTTAALPDLSVKALNNMTEEGFAETLKALNTTNPDILQNLLKQQDFVNAVNGAFPKALETFKNGSASAAASSGDLTIKAPSELNADGYVNLDQATMDKENSIKNFLKGLNSDIQNAILYNVKKHVDSNTV